MNKELIINAAPLGVDIALLENKKLVELHSEKTDARFAVGDLYLGKVKKLIPGLNAAFVDVGYEKDAFLSVGMLHFTIFVNILPSPQLITSINEGKILLKRGKS